MPSVLILLGYMQEIGQDINKKTVNTVINNGSSFAYFCGHGSPASWATHFPPNGTKWTTGYVVDDMISLRNLKQITNCCCWWLS